MTTQSSGSLYISVGVAGVVVVLLVATALVGISAIVCLRKRKNKIKSTDNVTYCECIGNEMELSFNAAYTTTSAVTSNTSLQNMADTYDYDYVDTTDISIAITKDKASAYVMRTGGVPTSHNQAYGMVQH